MTRRRLLGGLAAGLALPLLGAPAAAAPLTKPVPRSGEALPLVGLGSWITFNVGRDPEALAACAAVMAAFFAAGGRLIDSSPMYGSSQATIGFGLAELGHPAALFSADKVWTSGDGAAQLAESLALWGIPRFDLLQVHNLRDWEEHLPLLLEMRAAGLLRHVGITTSEGRRHDEIEAVMREHALDFVQLTYNPLDRAAEARLLPLAAERGIAVLANRPFRQGALTEALAGAPLPGFAAELDCRSWAQLILKFIVSHPAVTCAIPATTRVDHVTENLAAASEPLPDAALRAAIADAVADAA